MTARHWNDRADRDLFFTILSIKNIGVISAAEWKDIGNDMRVLGYGFTNEGCRQHFQGLRRSVSGTKKTGGGGGGGSGGNVEGSTGGAAVHGTAATATAAHGGIDPTRNPITRRPGHGRGRPKKRSKQAAAAADDTGHDGVRAEGPSADLQAVANGLRPLLPVGAGGAGGAGNGGSSSNDNGQVLVQSPGQLGRKRRREWPPQQPVPPQGVSSVAASAMSGDADDTEDEDHDGDCSHFVDDGGNDDDNNSDDNGTRTKRQRREETPSTARIEAHPSPPPLPPIEDDTVLAAFAAHTTSFPTEFSYGV